MNISEIINLQDENLKNIKQYELDWLEKQRINKTITIKRYEELRKEVLKWIEK